jgi:hypothetical protein
LFETPAAVAAALKRYRDVFDPATGSVITPSGRPQDPDRGPFRSGFIGRLDERAELRQRMVDRLTARDRLLLILWYVSDLQVGRIARSLEISRVHCYRIRDRSLRALCDKDPPSEGQDRAAVKPKLTKPECGAPAFEASESSTRHRDAALPADPRCR